MTAPMPSPSMLPLEVYDTTLRDGTQQQGVSPTVADKLRIAGVLDGLGVTTIEGGWPGANPKDSEFFRLAAAGELPLRNASLAAFGMTRRPGRAAETDPVLAALLGAGTDVVTIVGKSSDVHVVDVLGTDLAGGLAMVADSVALARSEGRRVVFDAEHFFDGHRSDRRFALDVVCAAAESGADCVVLCDTNGGALPADVAAAVSEVASMVPGTRVGIHAHDDCGLAVANSLAALAAGADHVQGTANGIGERCGNANLMTLLPTLQLKLGVPVLPTAALMRLTSAAVEISEILNLTPDEHAPYVGAAAFAHKAGLHASAMARSPASYQHVAPDSVGNDMRLLVSELAGRATVLARGAEMGLELDEAQVTAVLDRVKELEHGGWQFEAADASFELLAREAVATRPEHFRLDGYRVTVDGGQSGADPWAQATVRVTVAGQRLLGAGEGSGLVGALDHAFRAAVAARLPAVARLQLLDYKVRILDSAQGADATTRVLLRCGDGEREWATVGVSPNVIEASWLALADAYDYALLHQRP